jgi:predicted nucleotidyltransferase
VVPPDDGAPDARPPRLTDLVALCGHLNEAGARYVVIGGMAVIQAGFVRATEDIDLLVDASPENITRLRQALRSLPDRAIDEMADSDLDQYVVVRVADEVVVDLMKAACGIEYEEASQSIISIVIDGVTIPFASPRLLWRTKQTLRDKDRLDRTFLTSILAPDEC